MPDRIHLFDIPPEIHSKILFASLQASFDKGADESRYQPHLNPQTRLALVCRLWANLISSVPELWTQLSIDASSGTDEDVQKRLLRASEVLSKLEYSISLRIMGIKNLSYSRPVFQAIIDFIARHISRCQVLDFRIHSTCWSMLCEQGLEGAIAERLEALRIDCSTAIEEEDKIFDLSQGAPRLSSFTCESIYLCMVNLPWENLTNLDIRSVTVEECLSVLAKARNIEHLSIVNVVVGGQPPLSSDVSMAHLKSLAIYDHAEYDFALLMGKIRAPRLEYFGWMSDVLENTTPTLENLENFLRASPDLATFLVMHEDPDAIQSWVRQIWESALPLEVVVLKPNVLEFIRAPGPEVGGRYSRRGTKEWDDVLVVLPSARHML